MNTRSPAKRDTVSSRGCNPRKRSPKDVTALKGPDNRPRQPLRGWLVFRHVSSVGCTYGYSRPGPSRGHVHLTFRDSSFHVAHPNACVGRERCGWVYPGIVFHLTIYGTRALTTPWPPPRRGGELVSWLPSLVRRG